MEILNICILKMESKLGKVRKLCYNVEKIRKFLRQEAWTYGEGTDGRKKKYQGIVKLHE